MSDLILVPTERERRVVRSVFPIEDASLEVIGFGPISSAASTAALIAQRRPSRVVLIGIAGAFDLQTHPIGTSYCFDHVRCDGVGVGLGDQHQSASKIGWMQWQSADSTLPRRHRSVGDEIWLRSSRSGSLFSNGSLLSVCAASASASDREDRQRRFPGVTAEDMEGFSVAMACFIAEIPLRIVRGISNWVGDRDKSHWRIDAALAAAGHLASDVLREPWDSNRSETHK